MSNEDSESSNAPSASPLKRVENGKGETRASKRRKVDQGDHPLSTRELAPKPCNGVEEVSTAQPPQTSYVKPRTRTSSKKRRATLLNLRNYPSNHHPVGIGIWILQKVEQARKELENQQYASNSSESPRIGSQGEPLAVDSPSEYAGPHQWQASSADHVNVPPGQEQEAERLQAQRNRKTKQRQENWAKNKETDVVARAKIESKKHFDALPNATDAEQQAWIEEKIRLDFGRLLDRLAAQLNSEIVGIPLYQIGYADHYFNKATNPKMGEVDDETVSAARLIAYVLPALSESVVSHRHQNAAHALVRALVQGVPLQDSFIAAIFMLAQDPQVLAGLDKLLSNIFLPKTGSQLSQLARKRASNGSDQSGSGNGLNAASSGPAGAPIWHWKEPATLANSIRYNSHPTRAPASGNGGFDNTGVQPYYNDYLPPPIVVHAEVYRPPPPPPGYYRQPYVQIQPQSYYRNGYYPGPLPTLAPPSNWMNQGNHEGRFHGDWSTPLPYDAHAGSYQQSSYQPPPNAHTRSYQQTSYEKSPDIHTGSYQQPTYQPPPAAHTGSHQPLDAHDEELPLDNKDKSYPRLLDNVGGFPLPDGESASLEISLLKSGTHIVSVDASKARTPSEPPMASLPLAKDRHLMPTRTSRSPGQTRIEPSAETTNSHSASLPEVVVISDPAPGGGIRRKSSTIQTRNKYSAESNGVSTSPEETVITSDPAPDESLRRRSSRGTVLTSKAKAAGILLGTQVQNPSQTSFNRVSKTPRACNASQSPGTNGELPLAAADNASGTNGTLELAILTVAPNNTVAYKDPSDDTTGVGGFVPRSSGRERKPTAKVLASSARRSSARVTDYSSSVPRVSSRLRLSLSSQSSVLSENSIRSKATPCDKILSASSNVQTSPEVIEAFTASKTGSESMMSTTSTQSDRLRRLPNANADEQQDPIDERRAYPNNLRRRIIPDQQVASPNHQVASPDKQLIQPMVETNKDPKSVAPVNISLAKYQKFLTNDRGQGMGQALLMMAQVAAEWFDSDSDDEPASESEFQLKLRRAVDKKIQQSKSKANTATQNRVSPKKSPKLSQPVTRVLPTPSRAAREYPGSASSPHVWTGVPCSNAPASHHPVVSPSSGLPNGTKHDSTDPRSISQITDDFIILIRLKDEAKVHGLPVNDWMSLDELTSLVEAYHAGERNMKNSLGIENPVPSPSRVAIPSGAVTRSGPESRAAEANQRQKNKGSDETSTPGSTNGSRNSTPSTRGTSSATPQLQTQTLPIPTFKKGGTVMSFGKKAKRAINAASTRG